MRIEGVRAGASLRLHSTPMRRPEFMSSVGPAGQPTEMSGVTGSLDGDFMPI